MRESRCMSLLPRTTLHSDSEQFLFHLMIHEKTTKIVKEKINTILDFWYHVKRNTVKAAKLAIFM